MWKDVPTFSGRYEASETGEIRHATTKHIRKQRINKFGYCQINISRNDGTGKSNTVLVHKLIAETFIPNPDNLPEINHINGVKSDNRVENLEWCTRSENQIHAYKMGLSYVYHGEEHPKAKFTNEQAHQVKQMYNNGISQQKIADFFHVSQTTIGRILRGKRYANC
jgi:hypothetical protein